MATGIVNYKVRGVKYGTESYLTPLTLKLTMPMGMCTEHTLVGMLSLI